MGKSTAAALVACLGTFVSAQTAMTIDLNTKYQTIDGFGVSQAFGRAVEFKNANAQAQKQGLEYLFSTTAGAGFTIIRNRIGSGGNGDSILPSSPGSPSGNPSYKWDNDDKGQVWFSKQAMSYGVKTIYADAWSAPGFMKTSGSESTAGYVNNSLHTPATETEVEFDMLTIRVAISVAPPGIHAPLATGDRHTPTCSFSTSSTMLSRGSTSLTSAS